MDYRKREQELDETVEAVLRAKTLEELEDVEALDMSDVGEDEKAEFCLDAQKNPPVILGTTEACGPG